MSSNSLLVAIVDPVDSRPLRPRVVICPDIVRLRKDLKLNKTATALSKRRSNTIGAGITATNNNDIFTLCRNVICFGVSQDALSVGAKEVHGQVYAVEGSTGYREVTWLRCAATQHYGVKVLLQLSTRVVATNFSVCTKLNSFP